MIDSLHTPIHALWITLLCWSCGEDCEVDKDFQKEFFNCTEVAKEIHQNNSSLRFVHRVNSLQVLTAITGHESPIIIDGDTPYFYPYDEEVDYFQDDVSAWENWYKLNKCSFDQEKADSIINEYGIEMDWDLDWPPMVEIIRNEEINSY